MIDGIRRQILRFTKGPATPTPPTGAPGSIRVFRAGPNYYKILLVGWSVAQIGAIVGIVFSLWFLQRVDAAINQPTPPAAAQPVTAHAPTESVEATETTEGTEIVQASATNVEKKVRLAKRKGEKELAMMIAGWPSWTIALLHWAEYAAIIAFLLQIPVTLIAVRLEYEQHWYIVTDRSLRIRTGLVSIQESTMSFANLQQVEVKQGPLQRLLGIADVRVQSAGGGDHHGKGSQDSMHLGIFHGVENPTEIRDLILARLRRFRESGLGDPDDSSATAPIDAASSLPSNADTATAARELLAEARALRTHFQG